MLLNTVHPSQVPSVLSSMNSPNSASFKTSAQRLKDGARYASEEVEKSGNLHRRGGGSSGAVGQTDGMNSMN